MPLQATSKDIHAIRERLRHREINSTLDSFAEIIPGFSGKTKKEKIRLITFYFKYLYLNVCQAYDLPLECSFSEYEARLFNCDIDRQKDSSSVDKGSENVEHSLQLDENMQTQSRCLEEQKQDNIPTMKTADDKKSVVQNPSVCPQIEMKRKPNILLKKSYTTCVANTHVVPTNHPPDFSSIDKGSENVEYSLQLDENMQTQSEKEPSNGVLTKKENVSPCASRTQRRKNRNSASQIKRKPLKDCTNDKAKTFQ